MKRAFDIAASLAGLILSLPIMVFVALAIRLDDGGSMIFRQERVGRGGKLFAILKFRTMVENAAALGGTSTDRGDPRITRVGRVLRASSLDELPQFLNVLAGDMSIVGPRPDVPAQRTLYTDDEWVMRHRVRPGITGLAQALLRSDATPDQRKSLDLEYAMKPTLIGDLRILGLTLVQVLRKGSY